MDFGATLCTRADPACVLCPLQADCVALREGRVAELPTPKPGKPLPERSAFMLWLRDAHGRVLLQRRPPTGIWAVAVVVARSTRTMRPRATGSTAHVAGDYDAAETLAPIAHGFTHYRLQIQPLRWRKRAAPQVAIIDADLRWIARDAPALAGHSRAGPQTHWSPDNAPHRVLRVRPGAKPKAWTSCRGPAHSASACSSTSASRPGSAGWRTRPC